LHPSGSEPAIKKQTYGDPANPRRNLFRELLEDALDFRERGGREPCRDPALAPYGNSRGELWCASGHECLVARGLDLFGNDRAEGVKKGGKGNPSIEGFFSFHGAEGQGVENKHAINVFTKRNLIRREEEISKGMDPCVRNEPLVPREPSRGGEEEAAAIKLRRGNAEKPS
jgi:hypothetical protein